MKNILILVAIATLLVLSSCASSQHCDAYGSIDNNAAEELS